MKSKLALVGFMMAAAASYPVLSIAANVGHGHGNGNGNGNGNAHGHGQVANHVIGTGFFCDDSDDDFFVDGGFTRWVSDGHGHFIFQFGDTVEDTDDRAGLRIETGGRARSLSADWNLGNSDEPRLAIYFVDSVEGGSFTRTFNLSNDNSPFVTKTDLGNGYTRIRYDAVADGTSDDTYAGVYWLDRDLETTGTQTLRNVAVNGTAVTPNFVTTQLDCTFSGS